MPLAGSVVVLERVSGENLDGGSRPTLRFSALAHAVLQQRTIVGERRGLGTGSRGHSRQAGVHADCRQRRREDTGPQRSCRQQRPLLLARSQGGRISVHGPGAGFVALQTYRSVPELSAPLRARAAELSGCGAACGSETSSVYSLAL